MEITLTAMHGFYVAFILLIIGFMVLRRDTTVLCIVGILGLGWMAAGSLTGAVSGIFESFIFAIRELLGTILIISIVVSMSRVLLRTGINEAMISPFTRWIRTPFRAFWLTGLLMLAFSLFFWPSPAVALIGAVLLPVALRAGLPAIGAAMALNLFGHGIALSGDYVIQGAPKLTADAAGLPVSAVLQASMPLLLVMSIVTTVTAYWMLRRDMRRGQVATGRQSASAALLPEVQVVPMSRRARRVFAVLIPLLFAADVAALFLLKLQGGEATALVGGTALLAMLLVSLWAHRGRGLEQATGYLIEGFQFGFRVFGPVIPIAAFFYLGDSALTAIFGEVLPAGSHGLVNDLGYALAHTVPLKPEVGIITVAAVGAITGLDGSGFSGISLAGSIAQLFAAAIGSDAAVLTALGQIAAIWVGGGTLVPWALIPAAAICGVDPFELARRNLKPVLAGLLAAALAALFLI